MSYLKRFWYWLNNPPLEVLEPRSGQPVEVFSDYYLSPITVASAVQAIISVGTQENGGLWQASGSSCLSYYDLITEVRKQHGWGGSIVSTFRGSEIPDGFDAAWMSHRRLTEETSWKPPSLSAVISSFESM